MSHRTAQLEFLVGRAAAGELFRLEAPLSFWGGVDSDSGRIVDRNHPQVGSFLGQTALLMGSTRGSSSAASTLLECARRDTAPAMLLLTERDPMLVVGAAAAWQLYDRGPSVAIVSPAIAAALHDRVSLTADGALSWG